ncbi:discoidin domain-containing protein [Myxococcota bacterium]|nr:discoidin domain-containing protein [Myxococcota bacterium]
MTSLLLLAALPLAAQAGTITASSTAETDAGRQPAALAADGLLSTGWAEGASGDGAGEWLELDLGKPTALTSLSIWPGDLKQGKRSFRESGRPKLISVLVDGKPQGDPIRLLDQMQRLDVPLSVTGRKVRIVLDEAFGGAVFSDTFIAEVAVNFPDVGPAAASWASWLESDAAKRAHEKFDAELQEKYAAYKGAEFGDRDALAWIADAVAEGEPWLRQEAQRRIDVGYRAQAILSSARAQEAVRKLRDANAIPALEMAMLRATGEERAVLADTVEVFYAYQELVGNQGRTAPPWGESGFWKGALRGFGEPLAIERDADGNLYVADTGNNRVQRYGENGLVNKTWGGQPEISQVWFEDGRPYYVSGSQPGQGPGAFLNPLDLVLLPGKDGTGLAVLDAARRVQVFDASGAVTASFTIGSDEVPRPKVGGEGYLAWLPKKNALIAFLGDEAVVTDLSGNELDRWDIEHGTPTAVEVNKNGTLLLAFRDEVWQYSADGFPHSVRIDSDILGRGYEDIDLSYDSEGRLWALTDDGVIHKFKKPGKLDFQVDIATYSLGAKRLAVHDGVAWFTFDDQIVQVDAYQKWLDAQSAPAEGEGALDLDEVGR